LGGSFIQKSIGYFYTECPLFFKEVATGLKLFDISSQTKGKCALHYKYLKWGMSKMRMDNETYRLRVEGLLTEMQNNQADSSETIKQLEKLAVMPRKTRYFLKALSEVNDRGIQVHFYRHIMANCHSDDVYAALERQIKQSFYQSREETRALLNSLNTSDVLPTMFKVIALTEEGWLAGELIRVVLQAPGHQLQLPIKEALESQDYLLQCLAIYLVGKSGDEGLLEILANFYNNPVGEKLDRLEKKAQDALIEGSKESSYKLLSAWLKHRGSRVRSLALAILASKEVPEVIVDLIGLVLVDPKNRGKAAGVLIRYWDNRLFTWDKSDVNIEPVNKLLTSAKPEPLKETILSLLRDENYAVRQVTIELAGLLPEINDKILGQIQRLAIEDTNPSVQSAALLVLEKIAPDYLVPCLVEVFTDHAFGQGSDVLLEVANQIMGRALEEKDILRVEAGIKQKMERREAALERFAGTVEWWRHET
jgi:hypothetical protein